MTTLALPTSDSGLASDIDDVSPLIEALLHALEQPIREAACPPQSVRDVMRRLAIDLATARLATSKRIFAQADDFVVGSSTASGRLGS